MFVKNKKVISTIIAVVILILVSVS